MTDKVDVHGKPMATRPDALMKELDKTEEQKEHEVQMKRREEEKKKVKEESKKTIKELHDKIQDILYSYGGQESNIPVSHGYWDMMNQFRALANVKDTEPIPATAMSEIKRILDHSASDTASSNRAFAEIQKVLEGKEVEHVHQGHN